MHAACPNCLSLHGKALKFPPHPDLRLFYSPSNGSPRFGYFCARCDARLRCNPPGDQAAVSGWALEDLGQVGHDPFLHARQQSETGAGPDARASG